MSVAAIVLAAGTSSRMAGSNKLLADLGGKPILLRTLENILASKARPVVVVTGHDAAQVRKSIQETDVTVCFNENYLKGMATSLAAGIKAVGGRCSGVAVCLGDMPLVSPATINRLIDAFLEGREDSIVVPLHRGKRGNPAIFGAGHFARLLSIDGDKGARQLIDDAGDHLIPVEIASDEILLDADTAEALASLRHRVGG